MSIISESYADEHAASKYQRKAEVARRLHASEAERAQTHGLLASGNLVAANTSAHVANRQARLRTDDGLPTAIAPDLRKALLGSNIHQDPIEAQRAFERQIGGNDAQPCWFITRAAQFRRTVGRIHVYNASRRIAWATGFLVAPNLLLTNRHVLDSAETARFSRVEFDYEENYEGEQLPSAIFDLSPDSVFVFDEAVGGMDYALVAVAPHARADCDRPGAELADFGYNTLIREDGKLLKGEPINIIHHPKGQPRQVSMRANRLTAQDGPALQDRWLHYETDTDSGSSGAPLFNDQWEVVGVHHAGVEKRDEQGNVLAIGGARWTQQMGERQKWWSANEGLRISVFMRDVAAQLAAHQDESVAPVPERMLTDTGRALVEVMLTGRVASPPAETQQISTQLRGLRAPLPPRRVRRQCDSTSLARGHNRLRRTLT